MDFINMLKQKIPWKKEIEDDLDDPGFQTISFPQQPHLELFHGIKSTQRQSFYHSSIAKLWRVDKEGREAMYSCYLPNANCVVVITQNEMEKMALTYKYQHFLATISYELYVYTARSFNDWRHEQFHRPDPYKLESTHIVHVTALECESMIVAFGFNSSCQLALYCYCINHDSPYSSQSLSEPVEPEDTTVIADNIGSNEITLSLHCVKPFIIKQSQFSKLTTRVTGETQEDGKLAIIFSDFSDRPRPNLLFIWQMVPKILLLKYIDLRVIYASMRGVVSGLCFWNGQEDLILVTTASQLFHLSLVNDVFSKNYLNLKKKHIFLEKEEERINIVKLNPRFQRDMKEAIYGVGECGYLYLIPHLEDWRSQPIKMLSLTEKLPVQDLKVYCYHVSRYSKELFLLSQNRYLYVFDLLCQSFNNAICLPDDKHEIDEYWNMKMSVNWYGSEVYFICYDHLYAVQCPVISSSLKQLARAIVLKTYSEQMLVDMNLSKSILGYLFNKLPF